MKRYSAGVIIAVSLLLFFLVIFPVSLITRAERTDKKPARATDRITLTPRSSFKDLTSSVHVPSQDPVDGNKPIWGGAVNFAVSDPVRDLPTSRVSDKAQAESQEVNEQNRYETKTATDAAARKGSFDGALQPTKPIESDTPSTPSLTFDGVAAADNVPFIGGTVAPSDENLDVGPNDVIQTTNLLFRIWDKNGNPKTSPKLISSLFSKLGGQCSIADRGDPVVLYDRMADRWFLTQFAFATKNAAPFHQCVAVSQGPDPLGAYFTYDFVTPGNNFPDYGKFGVWPDGYYMTVNQFSEPGDIFNGVGMYALDRKKMLVGDPTAAFIYFDRNLTSFPEGYNSTLPSDQDGLQAPPPGVPNTFIYLISDEFESSPYNKDALRLFDFHADFTTPANSTFTERAESPLLVAPFDPRSPSGRADVKEPPPATTADALDSIQYHLMHRLQYRNRGGIETLVASTPVNVSGLAPTTIANYQAGVRYFQLQRSTPGGPFLLYDNATFSPDAGNPATGVNRWLPSAAIDHQGNLAVSYSASSTSVFPSIWYAGRDFNALGGLTGETHLFDGTAVQTGSSNRWGDYQSLQVDPSDDCTFWTTNQYYNVNSGFNWRTRIGRFKFPTCSAPPQGTISGIITACDSGVPISNAMVTLSNGFSGTSKADGTYSIKAAPGTYAVTVTDSTRSCTPSASSTVTVTDGATTTFNSCLNGLALVTFDKSVAGALTISGGNGNGIIDANECNNLNVKVVNPGCAPARNITTTLSTSTPNVTITQSHSPYADIPVDSAPVSNLVPYSIGTNSSFVCGTTINFTLVTSFTGGSTTSTFSLPTCNETQPDITVSGSIDPADPKSTQGRISRDGITSTCSGKSCPGALGTGGRSFDTYSFTNTSSLPTCATTTLSSAGGVNLIGSTYLGSYNPADTTFCVNYAGDPGGSANGDVAWLTTVPAGGTLVVVVMEVNAGTASTPYTVKVSGLGGPQPAGNGVCATCTVTAPANVTVNNDPNQCGAVVTFPAATTTGTCGVVSASPASGSFFPVGTTTVTTTTTAGTTATHTVTVTDTQKPTITCPANIAAQTAPNATTAPVTFTPTATDNCPGVTVGSSPASGSTFNLGTTTVNSTATDALGNTAQCSFTVTLTQPQTIQFSSPTTMNINEGGGQINLVVNRAGGSVGVATVDYATTNGSATQLGDYTIKVGTLTFADGETSKVLPVLIVDDNFVEGPENFTVTLSNATGTGVSLGANTITTVTIVDNDTVAPTSNPIDGAQFFVRQHYLDFLNREADLAGFNFWTNTITSCPDASCVTAKRISASAAFFLSIESQETGGFAIRMQRSSFSKKSQDPLTRVTYLQFMRDAQTVGDGVIVGAAGADAKLEANKQAYATQLVTSSAFITLYPTSLTADPYVTALFNAAGVTPTASEKSAAITAFGGGGTAGRVAALRSVADSSSVRSAEFSPSFVLMEYFGYLRRNPTDAPDNNDSGYQFWLGKLNTAGGDFRKSDMVKAFIDSSEYRARFGP